MWSILALGIVERALNAYIDLDQISRIRLDQLQGKCLRLVTDAPVMSLDIHFDQSKIRLEPTPTGHSHRSNLFEQRPFDPKHVATSATTTLQVATWADALHLMMKDEQSIGNIPVQGDHRLLFELQAIIHQLSPDVATALTPWIGPGLASELARLNAVPKYFNQTLKSAEFAVTDALMDHHQIWVARWQLDELTQAQRLLQQQIDRADAKLQRLEADKH